MMDHYHTTHLADEPRGMMGPKKCKLTLRECEDKIWTLVRSMFGLFLITVMGLVTVMGGSLAVKLLFKLILEV